MPYNRTSGFSSPGFVADRKSITRLDGRQIDWNYVPDSYRSTKEIVKVNDAAANAGDTTITVDALPIPLLAGQMLNFGTYAPVTVTTSAQAAAAATSISVNALSGPIPSGTVLDFTGAGEFAVLTAAAAAGATSLAVEALDAQIESGDTALFAGGTRQARVTANAAAGATSLTVDELQFPIADDAEATVGGSGDKVIPQGTVMAEMSGGKVVPRADRPGSETAVGFLVGTAYENAREHALTGYGIINGGNVYEDLLPDRDHASFSTFITEINTAGPGVSLQTYSDSRAS